MLIAKYPSTAGGAGKTLTAEKRPQLSTSPGTYSLTGRALSSMVSSIYENTCPESAQGTSSGGLEPRPADVDQRNPRYTSAVGGNNDDDDDEAAILDGETCPSYNSKYFTGGG